MLLDALHSIRGLICGLPSERTSKSATPDQTRILLVDDHTLLGQALQDLLLAEGDFRIVGAVGSGEAAVALAAQTQPDIVLLDVEMPGGEPMRTVRRLRDASLQTKVIILSRYDDVQLMGDMLTVGACGYLHKSVSCAELLTVIRAVHRHNRRITVSASPQPAVTAVPPAEPLSEREREVLILVARALSNRQIAGQLSITEGTVKRHLRSVFGKLGAVSRIDAVNKATAAALLEGRRRHGSRRPAVADQQAAHVPIRTHRRRQGEPVG
jgi:two-component system, NarL family, nitrate/nitrite response regulator NarL